MDAVTAEDVVRTAQAVQRDRRELLGLLSDVCDCAVGHDTDGSVVIHLTPSLFEAIRRRARHAD